MIFVIRAPHITATHCMLYRHALAAKSLPEKLENVRTNKGGSSGAGTFFEQKDRKCKITYIRFRFAQKLPITCIIQ